MNARAVWILVVGLAMCGVARAHKGSDSYLFLSERGAAIEGAWDLSLYDLDYALELAPPDGALTWGDVRAREADIRRYVLAQLGVRRGGEPCALELGTLGVVEHSDGNYLRFTLRADCSSEAHMLEVEDRFFFELDPQHRSFLRFEQKDGTELTSVAGVADGSRVLLLGAAQGAGASRPVAAVASFVMKGAAHILDGLDHVLFLLVLLLPAVLQRSADGWRPVVGIRSVLGDVVKIVTAFTIAHSLTLSLSALGLVRVSAAVIEPAIAASVALAALNNLWPLFGRDRWVAALALGLLHGFGFSSALTDAGVSGSALGRALFGFNLGVELGQLAIVLGFVPLAFWVRRAPAYRRFGLFAGSFAVFVVSVAWFVQRIPQG